VGGRQAEHASCMWCNTTASGQLVCSALMAPLSHASAFLRCIPGPVPCTQCIALHTLQLAHNVWHVANQPVTELSNAAPHSRSFTSAWQALHWWHHSQHPLGHMCAAGTVVCCLLQSGVVRLSHVSLLRRSRGPGAAPQHLPTEPLRETHALRILSWLATPGTNQEVRHCEIQACGTVQQSGRVHCLLCT
jgi:hypothetical protein